MDDRVVVSMSGSELLTAYDVLHEEITERKTRQAQIVARLDEMGHAKTIGAHDTARLLIERYRLDPAEAHRRVRFATQLHKYPAVAAALPVPGSTNRVDGGDDYATDRHDHHNDGGGDDCNGVDGHDHNNDGGGGDDRPGVEGNGDDRNGGGVGGVVLHMGQAEAIVAALENIPAAANVAVEDLVEAELRMVQAAEHLPPSGLRKLGVQVRDILDTDGPEPREDAARRREDLWVRRADGGVKFGGYLAGENAERLETVLQSGAKPHKTIDGAPDPRPRGKRQADALTDALDLALGTGGLPGHGGIKPHITITIDLDTLIEAGTNATGTLVFGDGLSASAIRRLACDAGIIPVVLGSDSQPLDVGREHRLVTVGLRNALNLRDRGCVVCNAPPVYCDAHHLTSWLDGGVTSLTNTVLLCRVHHTALHQGHWTITITDNQVHVTRPTWATRPSRHRTPTPPRTPAPAHPAAPATPTSPEPTTTTPQATTTTPTGATTTPTGSSPNTGPPTTTAPSAASATDPWPADASPPTATTAASATDPWPADTSRAASAADPWPADTSPPTTSTDSWPVDTPPPSAASATDSWSGATSRAASATDPWPADTSPPTTSTDPWPADRSSPAAATDSWSVDRSSPAAATDSWSADTSSPAAATDSWRADLSPAVADADTCSTDSASPGTDADVDRVDLPASAADPGAPAAPARAWPFTRDAAWITSEESAALNPWGDEPDTAKVLPLKPPDTVQFDPWVDSA